MMLLDPNKLNDEIERARAVGHNLPPDMLGDRIAESIGDYFDKVTEKCHSYVIGDQILDQGGHFDVISLGNWMSIAARVGVPTVPTRIIHVMNTLHAFSMSMGNDHQGRPEFLDMDNAFMDRLQYVLPNEMLRFDQCASMWTKSALSEGESNLSGPAMGWVSEKGRIVPVMCERLSRQFLESTSEHTLVHAREIVKPRTRTGWTINGKPGEWPIEWRVYVEDGDVVGVSNYYPQSPSQMSADTADQIRMCVHRTREIVAALREAEAYPHHPRYEGVFENDPTFTLDFIVTSDDVLLIEGGPGHVFDPPWGAHPCCFNPVKGIRGLALGPGDTVELPVYD